MRSKRSRRAIALGALSALSAIAAYAIHFVSDGHGHGLASPDRVAIWALSLVAAGSAAGVLWILIRRR